MLAVRFTAAGDLAIAQLIELDVATGALLSAGPAPGAPGYRDRQVVYTAADLSSALDITTTEPGVAVAHVYQRQPDGSFAVQESELDVPGFAQYVDVPACALAP